jgi:hypothetical protein
MSGPRLSTLVTATLDPVLAGSPFTPGQTGELPDGRPPVDPASIEAWPRHGASITWCARYVEVRRELPALPQAHEQDGSFEDRACVDLVVRFDRGGRLEAAEIEAEGLARTLRAVGRHAEALEAAALLGQPAEVACPALGRLLAVLLEAARTPLS